MVDFNIRVVVDSRQAQTGVRQVEGSLNRVSNAATRMRRLLVSAFAIFGAGAGIAGTIRTLANFSQEMSTVRAITGATEEQFGQLRDVAKELGATTRFSASEAAAGMTFLARAGFDTNQVLGTIEGTLQLAQAGALDLASAADIASNVLQGFRLQTSETARVVDVLAKGANISNTSVSQLGEAMSFAAPVAAGLGVSIEETAGAIGALSNAGLQASRAGTGLSRVMAELESPSNKTQEILRSMGVTTEEVRVSQVGLTGALLRLRDAGIDTGTALEIFGQRGGPAFEVLSSSIPDVQRLTGELENAEGTAEEIARIMDDNLNGALLAVKSAIEAVVIAFGDLGAESGLTITFRGLATALRFVADNMAEVSTALSILLAGFALRRVPALFAQAILLVRNAVVALTVAIAANPIGILITALTLGISALTVFQDRIIAIEGTTVTFGDVLRSFAEVIGPAVVSIFNAMGASFEDVGEIFNSVISFMARGFTILIATAGGTVRAIEAAFENFPRALAEIAILAVNGFIRIIQDAVNLVNSIFNRLFEALGISLLIPLADLTALRIDAGLAGTVVADAFREGFEEVIEGALTSAAQRELSQIEDSVPDVLVSPPSTPATTRGGRSTPSEFDKILDRLRREGELLKLNNQEREIRQGLLAIEDQLDRQLTETEQERARAILEANQALADERALIDQILGPQEDFMRSQAALNRLLSQGAISADQFNQKMRELRIAFLDTQRDFASGAERAFLRIQDDASNFAQQTEDLLVGAFNSAQDALVEFTQTGKLSFSDLISSMSRDLVRLGTNELFTAFTGGGGAGGGIGGLFTSLFSGGGLLGFQNGVQDLPVNAVSQAQLPGVDNRLVAFRARSDETISVNRNGESNARPINVNFNFPPGTDTDSFRRSSGQIEARTAAVLQRASARNN